MTKGAIMYVEDNNENRALIRRVRDARIQVQEYTDHRLDRQRDAGRQGKIPPGRLRRLHPKTD